MEAPGPGSPGALDFEHVQDPGVDAGTPKNKNPARVRFPRVAPHSQEKQFKGTKKLPLSPTKNFKKDLHVESGPSLRLHPSLPSGAALEGV